MKTKLRAYCATDPDLCGSWSKDETEQEITELTGRGPDGDDWVYWILDYLFSDFKLNTESLKDVLVWSGGRVEISNPDGGSPIVLELD